jgi:hypothetical protein
MAVHDYRSVRSIINRYYDPATDQFLSIDPDVAKTDQPYIFTNDDPLNAEDPLGDDPLGDWLGRGACAVLLSVNCLGQGGTDLEQNLSSGAAATTAVVSGTAEEMERTAKKAAGEPEGVVEEVKETGESIAKKAEEVRVAIGVRTSDIISDLTGKSASPTIKIGPIKISITDFDFDFGF